MQNAKVISLMLVFFMSFCSKALSQISPAKKIKILPLPFASYEPETRLILGAAAFFTLDPYQDSITRVSNTRLEFKYTLNKQMLVESQWNYFFKEESWLTTGFLQFSKYVDNYYGLGATSSIADEANFEGDRIIVDLNLYKNLGRQWFVGTGYKYYSYKKITYINEDVYFPELRDRSSYGFKALLLKDSRDRVLTPTEGIYIALDNIVSFSSGTYYKAIVDLRKYYVFGSEKQHVLAGRIYNSMTFGTPPFYDYSLIGGDKYIRGYFFGRYRDQHLSTTQLEFRFDLPWRFGFGVFGGLTMIYPNFSEIDRNSFKPNAGIGLRFLIDKQENTSIRLDYAIGSHGQNGFYLGFGESF